MLKVTTLHFSAKAALLHAVKLIVRIALAINMVSINKKNFFNELNFLFQIFQGNSPDFPGLCSKLLQLFRIVIFFQLSF